MKATKYKEEITTRTIYKTDACFNIIETITDNKSHNIKLVCDDEELEPMMFDFPEGWKNECKRFEDIYKYAINANSIENIDLNNVYFVYSSGNMLFDHNKEIVSTPYTFGYIGSLQQRFENDQVYKKLIDLLKEHQFVTNLEEKEIPHYNADFSGQMGIYIMSVVLSPEEQKKLYKKCTPSEFWSVRMRDYVRMSLGYTGVYGPKIDSLLKEYWNDCLDGKSG